jgi:hypothetical protein
MGVTAVIVSADGVVLIALWECPTSSPLHGDGYLDDEVSREMDVATSACSTCGRQCRGGRWCYGWGCIRWWVEAVVPAVSSTEHLGRLDPVG